MKTCAILDLFSVHDHVIPSHIKYLTELGYKVTVYSPTQGFQEVSALLPSLEYDVITLDASKYQGRNKNHFRERYLKGFDSLDSLRDFDLVLLNTFRTELPVTNHISSKVTNALAVLHTPKHGLKQSRYKHFVANGHRALVLSRAMGEAFNLPWVVPLTYADDQFLEYENNASNTVFCVPGTVRFTGRTYSALVRSVQKLKQQGKENFIVKVVGRHDKKDGEIFLKEIHSAGVSGFFQFLTDTTHEQFVREIIDSDFVMPLIDKYEEKVGARHYSDMITSSVFLALGLEKVMVCESELASAYEFSDSAFVHKGGQLEVGMLTALEASSQDVRLRQEKMSVLRRNFYLDSIENLGRITNAFERPI